MLVDLLNVKRKLPHQELKLLFLFTRYITFKIFQCLRIQIRTWIS